MRRLSLLILTLICSASMAQELKVNVIINTDQITSTVNRNKNIYKNMQVNFQDFMNKRQWTKDKFEPHERINVNLLINITKQPNFGVFQATCQLQVSRPVFGTDYESILINYFDNSFNFNYLENQPMEFNDNAFTNNITSLLAYYSYIALAVDYDSFSKKGGQDHIEKAWNVVNNAQQAGGSGWRASENTINRYWLAFNLNSPQLIKFREDYYSYHREAMDNLTTTPKKSQQTVIAVLKSIKKTRTIVPVSILLDNFFDTKVNELVSIFSEGDQEIKKEAHTLLRQVDATHGSQYDKIVGK